MKTVVIEKTSKKFKLIKVMCWLTMLIVCPVWVMIKIAGANVVGGDPSYAGPAILFAVALVMAVVNRFMSWWCHG